MGIFVTYADFSYLSREWLFLKYFGCFYYPNKKEVVIDIHGKSTDVYNNFFFIQIIETAKSLKKEPFWGQTLQIPWDHVGQKIKKWF